MKKMLQLLIVLMIGYFIIQIIFRFVDKGHDDSYTVKTGEYTFNIKEKFTLNNKDSNYYLEINVNDEVFDIQLFNDLKLSKRIVTDVYYYDRDYKCILPIINGDIVTDIICKKDNTYYNYVDLNGKSSSLDLFAFNLNEIGYSKEKYELSYNKIQTKGNISVYDSLLKNHYLAIENYKGLTTINLNIPNKIYNVNIFNFDVYSKTISCFVDKYYVIADYSKKTKFNEFIVVDITNNKTRRIKYDYDISMDSYILGTMDKKIYLFDNDTKSEYEIDLKNDNIIQVGNVNTGIKMIINGEEQTLNAYDVYNNKLTFTNYKITTIFNDENYDSVLNISTEKSGYYYIFENVENKYRVYRSNIQNGITKKYLFETTSENILCYKDNVYYIDGKYLKRYNEISGNKIIVENPELEFNNNIKIGLYN